LKIKIKKNTTNIVLTWIIILISAKANAITISNITLVIAMFLTMFIFIKRRERLDKFFVYFSIAYFTMYAIHIIKFGYIDLREFREYLKILYGYMFIKLVYKDFFKYYVDIVYKLALISLPLYAIQLLDYDLMRSIIGILDHNISFLDYRGDWYENLFFFTLNDNGMYRNSGFAWEPKGFGTFLTLAFLFNLFLNRFNFFDKKNIIFLIAMITTLSTATYSVFLLTVLSFYLYNKKVSYKTIASIVILPIIFMVFTQVDFMEKKIIEEYKTTDKYVDYQYDRKYAGKTRSLGRFGSFILDYYDTKKEPLIGYGLYSDERTMYSVNGVKLIRVSGLSDWMAKFGFVGLALMILFYFLSFKKISKQFKFKGYFFIPISIIATSFASAILLTPMYLSLMLYWTIKKRI